jgi:hypothetical protein
MHLAELRNLSPHFDSIEPNLADWTTTVAKPLLRSSRLLNYQLPLDWTGPESPPAFQLSPFPFPPELSKPPELSNDPALPSPPAELSKPPSPLPPDSSLGGFLHLTGVCPAAIH